MATYKVIQDIEAEDKLLGPLTLKQFSYAGITVACLWLCFFVWSHGATFMIAFILPFAFISAFFAFPWSHEQPTELWALARIGFFLKPRKRIWDQSGLKELVTITVPKRIEHTYSDGLSQTEVRSRLHALAETIDSRGWAIKNTAMNPYISPAMASVTGADDRLIDPGTVPQDVPNGGNDTYEDVFDAATNPKIQQFDSMLTASAQAHHAQIVATMQQTSTPQLSNNPQPPADYWFLNQPSAGSIPKGNDMFGTATITPGSISENPEKAFTKADEALFTETLKAKASSSSLESSHMATILPLEAQERRRAEAEAQKAAEAAVATPVQPIAPPAIPQMTAPPDAAILGLAHNDDLDIATIARQAKRDQSSNDGEVVISLH